jgi:ribosome biogenesis SPOUT family RNA methylase Rps3
MYQAVRFQSCVAECRLTVGTETLQQIPYVDYPELRIDKNETTQMPFRYVKDENGQPMMPEVRFNLHKLLFLEMLILLDTHRE